MTGHSVSEMTEVDSLNSIEHRFGQLLQYLAMNDPEGRWEEYLEGGRPAWSRIILAGHSQGSGNAGFLSKLVAVDRVLLFAGPQDYLARFDHPAGWLSFKGKTPPSRYFSFLNLNDPFNVHNQLANDMKMMGMNKADTLHVWPRQAVQGHQHILVTDSLTTDGGGPHSSVLDPEYMRVWEYMLTARLAEE